MWYTILQLLNYIGIITNAFIIAISSSFGRKYKTTTVLNVVSNTTTLNGTVSMVDTKTVTVSTLEYLWIIILFQVGALLLLLAETRKLPPSLRHLGGEAL